VWQGNNSGGLAAAPINCTSPWRDLDQAAGALGPPTRKSFILQLTCSTAAFRAAMIVSLLALPLAAAI